MLPANACGNCKGLREVELGEGLMEIWDWSFWNCDQSIRNIIIPVTIRVIGVWAFVQCLRTPIFVSRTA